MKAGKLITNFRMLSSETLVTNTIFDSFVLTLMNAKSCFPPLTALMLMTCQDRHIWGKSTVLDKEGIITIVKYCDGQILAGSN